MMSSYSFAEKINKLQFSSEDGKCREKDFSSLINMMIQALIQCFDNECQKMRRDLRKLGKSLFNDPDNYDLRNNYFRKKKGYNKLVKSKKRDMKQKR